MIDLLPHNIPTYEELCKQMENHNKCALVQATGTGKSYIIAKYLEEHPGKSLILVPTNAIGSQWEKLLSRTECDFTVDTYQGMSAHIDDEANYDIVVADEMHHLGSEVWGNAFINRFMQNVSQKVIGTTATEIRYLDNSRDMVEELFDGVTARGCDLKTAIEKEILPTFTYVSVWYGNDKDYEEYADIAKKIKDKTTKEQILGKLELCKQNQKSIEQAIKENLSDEPHKIIVFLNSVDSMDNTEKAIKKAFSAKKTYKINSRMKKGTVNKNISDFENDNKRTTILYAIDMLNEGVHIDGVDVVAFLRTTESPAIYFQQLGRCLAVSKVNHKRTVFDFVCNSSNIKSLYNDEETEEKGLINIINKGLPKQRKLIVKNYIKELEDLFCEIEDFISPLWRQDEIQFIKEHSHYTIKELASELNRSEMAIRHVIYQKGLDYKKIIEKPIYEWEEKQINYLKQNIGYISIEQISKNIGMSSYIVEKKAIELGIYKTKSKRNICEEIKLLGETSTLEAYEIAKILKADTKSVKKCLDINNIPYKKRKNNHKWNPDELDYLSENRDKGVSWLAQYFGTTEIAVYAAADRYGIKLINKNEMTKEEKEQILQLHEKGFSCKEIEKKTGKNCSAIYAYLKRNGKNCNIKRQTVNIIAYKDGKEIQRFKSIKEASVFFDIPKVSISNNIHGRTKTVHGYVFKIA